MPFRDFSPELEAIAATWATSASSGEAFEALGSFGSSESQPFQVRIRGDMLGLGKPGTRKGDGICRAAHEKIASDWPIALSCRSRQ